MSDPHLLSRFVEAQAPVYEQALAEIRRGRKTTHWMWFIFPQIAGLGFSEMSRRFAIASLDEARAYLAHPVLGRRYRECVNALQGRGDTTAVSVFGPVDAQKLQSSLTLFACAAPDDAPLEEALARWFGNERDWRTLEKLSSPLSESDRRFDAPAWRVFRQAPTPG